MKVPVLFVVAVCFGLTLATQGCSEDARDVTGPTDPAAEVTELYSLSGPTLECLPGVTPNAYQDPGGGGGGAGCFPETPMSCPYEWNIGAPPCPFDPNCQVVCPIECACCY